MVVPTRPIIMARKPLSALKVGVTEARATSPQGTSAVSAARG